MIKIGNLTRFQIILILLFAATLLKEVVFTAIIPIWQTPDEQAHFAQVAYFSEMGFFPTSGKDLNREIYESENLLGTLRDDKGNNKFTFHPEYKIEYTGSETGKYENEIKNLPLSYRRDYVKQEAADYPPLYYAVSSVFYKAFYHFDLFTRVYAVRFFSIILSLVLVLIAFLIGKEVFPENELLQVTLPIFVSFQPMLSFVSVGVNSDNLMNTLFSVLIYLGILIIKRGVTLKLILLSVLTIILLYFTKPQFIYAIPVLGLAILLSIKNTKSLIISFCISIIAGVSVIKLQNTISNYLKERTYLFSFFPGYKVTELSFVKYTKNALTHTYAEVLPWYWGVFDWLGVTLPHIVNKIINYTAVLAGFGFLINLVKNYKNRLTIFMLLSAVIYFAGVSYYDYLFILGHGFSFGIQGRYFFPTIVPEMYILLVGLFFLIPNQFKKFKNIFIKITGLLMIFLNVIALNLIVHTYYNVSNLNSSIAQVSQYKPGIFKGTWLEIWLTVYLLILITFVTIYIKLDFTKPVGKKSLKSAS